MERKQTGVFPGETDMENQNYRQINISSPNVISICVDRMKDSDISGRCYHYYCDEPIHFSNIVELLCVAEGLFDRVSFPQSSTRPKSLRPEKGPDRFWQVRPDKIISWEELIEKQGELATFIISVKFRHNCTWQGDFLWKEEDRTYGFLSAIDFAKEIVRILQ